MTGNNGGRIFVSLSGKAKILLEPGTDFQVTDANGTDKDGASFTMPTDVSLQWVVYVRALGKPGGTAKMQTCYTDAQTGETWCALDLAGGVEPVTIGPHNGKSSFTDVSKDLLFVDVCTAYDSAISTCTAWDTEALFSDTLDQYFWDYDNNGLKLAQLRFYPAPAQ